MKLLAALVLAAGLTAGCSHLPRLSWPWAGKPAAAPIPVDELTFAPGASAAIPQFWQGNTLVLDMTAAPANGTAVATPTYARGWPMRIAVRTWPGRFGALEVRGAQRALLPVTTEGTAIVEIPIPPEVHVAGTREIALGWGASIAPAVFVPQAPATPK
ncbi:MAG: hypothetical protein CMLOHMNK_02887 [Steroidobacteraceae bacterium]|nr:hypothetical protein [Steroidobacteraceae bacterium]